MQKVHLLLHLKCIHVYSFRVLGICVQIAQFICLQKQLENLIQAAVEITVEVCCRVKRYGIFPEMSRQTAMK